MRALGYAREVTATNAPDGSKAKEFITAGGWRSMKPWATAPSGNPDLRDRLQPRWVGVVAPVPPAPGREFSKGDFYVNLEEGYVGASPARKR